MSAKKAELKGFKPRQQIKAEQISRNLQFAGIQFNMPLSNNYFEDTKFCPCCREYVLYLKSPKASYCSDCGAKVRLFSAEDKRAFKRSLKIEKRRRVDEHNKRVS